MNKESINALVEKYLNGTSSREETVWVELWLNERSKESGWNWRDEKHKEEVQKEIFKKIDEDIRYAQFIKRNRLRSFRRIATAAVLIIALAMGFWFFHWKMENKPLYKAGIAVKPGTKAATLQLGNGEVVYLDNKGAGILSQSDELKISKVAGGIIQYNTKEVLSLDRIVENSLSIPRGGQYQLMLSDGTNVWLNSETKLFYPNQFAGKERRVRIIGEAYFKVAKDIKHPFIVESEGMDIRVTGTEFNVSAYKRAVENMTTLIEGSVEIHNRGELIMKLSPGQQAYKNTSKPEIKKRLVDVNTITSWKKGYFSFDYQSLEEVMNDISRWYDIDYKIIGKAKNQDKLGGTFSREKSIDELLAYLEQLVNVKIIRKERSVIIMY